MKNTLRDALMAALTRYNVDNDAFGVLHFLRGWLSVQPEKDAELIEALKRFTEGENKITGK